ncbi:RNA polymerase sigma factor [Streptomyces sp. bgisy027]|uniref:RNA polymerase sigma factor n=1 Tax=Streptomyces sp. bgisy027 TaxID=3413770 RepID=UPI003D75A631
MSEAGKGVDLTLEEIHSRHYGELVGFARKKLRAANVPQSFIDPEDIVGNAFLKVCRDPARIEQPRAYLFQIVKREILEHRRRARHYEQAAESAQADLRLEADDVSDVISTRCEVRHALASLPAQQRAAVWATKGLGWSHAEYAQAAQKGPGTVATHVSRAVAVLKRTLVAATFVTAIFGCAAGGVTLRRYTAASRAGRPYPELVPDVPQSAAVLLRSLAVAYLCVALALVTLLLVPHLRRLLTLIRRWIVRSPELPTLDEPPGFASGASRDRSEHCPTCGEETEHRMLTAEEKKQLYALAGEPYVHRARRCTANGCLAVKYGSADAEGVLLLPEPTGPQASSDDETRLAMES